MRSVLALPLLAGQMGVVGSGVMSSLSEAAPVAIDPRDPDEAPDRPRPRRINMNSLGALLTDPDLSPPIAVLFVQGGNPAAMNPNQRAVHAGLARDDLFTVVHDQVLTDTARFADVVLPATTHFEAADVAVSYGSYALQPVHQVIARVGESRTNDEVAAALAARLGYPMERYRADPAVLASEAITDGLPLASGRELRAEGTTVQLRDTGPTFPSAWARLHHPGMAFPPLPQYVELDAEAQARYPLTLITPATHRTINSIFGERGDVSASIALHPADAEARGIGDGDRVRVWNDHAELAIAARVDPDARPGVAVMPKGLWCREIAGGLTANALVPDTLSDLAGGACFNDTRVDVAVSPEHAPGIPPA